MVAGGVGARVVVAGLALVAPQLAAVRRWGHVVAAAGLLTALNAAKPVHIDDPAYLLYAGEFAAHPLDPYGFRFGSPVLGRANDLLVPPVLPYWLAAGTAVVGADPALLKLWLFPVAVLLAWALDSLAARAAPSLRAPVVWLGLLSPAVLPGFNLMLDVPVAALGLAAVAAAVRAVERDSLRLAVLAGVVGGLAVQTKYTGAVPCAAAVLWCLLLRRPRLAAAVGVTAAVVAVGWECAVALTQGESHFLVHFRQRQGKPVERALHLVVPLVGHLAGLAPAVAVLGLAALRGHRRAAVAAGVVAVALAVLALAPAGPLAAAADGRALLTWSNVAYALLALVVWPAVAGVCVRLARGGEPGRALDRFLLAWLALEVAGYFALSPFPAARRLVGLVLVLTLAAARLAHREGVSKSVAGWAAAGGAAVGLLVFAADTFDARAGHAAARAAAAAHAPAPGGTYWHLAWWGVSDAADRAGLRPLQLDRELPRPGDLLAVHDRPELRAFMSIQPVFRVELVDAVDAGDRFPLRACTGYYDGRTPLEPARGPRARVLVYRVVGP